MENRKMRLKVIITAAIIFSQVGMFSLAARAADSAQYEMKGWKMSVVGDSAGINFGYIGSDGVPLVGMLPMPKSLVTGHGNDPSWTQYDSAAPLLAYIQKYGIDNNITDSMNAICYDPSIFKSLSAQGINFSTIGGPDVPPGSTPPAKLVGKTNYGSNIDKVLVGVGVPAPDLSSISGTTSTNKSTSTTTAPSPKVTETTPDPTPPAPTPTPAPDPAMVTTPKATTSTPKVGTDLNPVPKTQESVAESKVDPQRTDPPVMALEDKTQTKIESPIAKNNESSKTTWTWSIYAEIIGSVMIVLGLIVFVKFKYLKA